MLSLIALATVTGLGTPYYDGWPPVRFTQNNSAFVHFASQETITAKCDEDPDPSDLETEACSFGPPNEMYLPNPCTFPKWERFARLACHELGHLNHWGDKHPR